MKIEAVRKLEALEEKKQLLAKKAILKRLQEKTQPGTETISIYNDLQSSESISLGKDFMIFYHKQQLLLLLLYNKHILLHNVNLFSVFRSFFFV